MDFRLAAASTLTFTAEALRAVEAETNSAMNVPLVSLNEASMAAETLSSRATEKWEANELFPVSVKLYSSRISSSPKPTEISSEESSRRRERVTFTFTTSLGDVIMSEVATNVSLKASL